MAETNDRVVPALDKRGPLGDKATASYKQLGAHARSKGLIAVTNNMKEFVRIPGVWVEKRV